VTIDAEGAVSALAHPPLPTAPAATRGPLRPTRTRQNASRAGDTTAFAALLNEVRDAGLLAKRPGYYAVVAAINALLGAGAVTALLLLGPTPWQLLVAAVLGLVLAQFGFLAHEAAHRQIFARGPANDLAARIIGPAIVGLSYTWWQQSHNRHHANPNVVGKDPSVEPQTFVFRPEDVGEPAGPKRAFLHVQGYLILPLLLLEGLNLHASSIRELVSRRPDRERLLELVLVVARLAALPALVFVVLPPGLAVAFLAVQLGVFGLYLGGSFVPNHVGMPVLEQAHGLDYLRKQVLTSRNLRGGGLASTLTGGLSLQIEHHLFPGMARPNLLKARPIVLAHCAALGIPYTEMSTTSAWIRVIGHLNRVGTSARGSFRCPMTEECGRS
jgi:fatty acid desaturase